MRYAEARLTPESQVTQTTPRERREAPRTHSEERRALAEVNRNWESGNAMYKMGVYRGRIKGFIYGLVTGALAVAVLAAVVLGDVLSG